MKKILTVVFIAFLALLLATLIFLYIEIHRESSLDTSAVLDQAHDNVALPSILNDRCEVSECLIKLPYEDLPRGIAEVKGYFLPIEREAYWSKEVCNGFVITEGPEVVLQELLALIDEDGNTLNTKNDLNQVIINLDFDDISTNEENTIRVSSPTSIVSLRLFLRFPEPTDAPVCAHIAKVLDVL